MGANPRTVGRALDDLARAGAVARISQGGDKTYLYYLTSRGADLSTHAAYMCLGARDKPPFAAFRRHYRDQFALHRQSLLSAITARHKIGQAAHALARIAGEVRLAGGELVDWQVGPGPYVARRAPHIAVRFDAIGTITLADDRRAFALIVDDPATPLSVLEHRLDLLRKYQKSFS